MTTFVILLRGINVGGNKKVPMADLKKLLEKTGYENVRTLLNSGNVVMDSEKSVKPDALVKTLEPLLEKFFKFRIPVLVRTMSDLQKLAKTDPFKGIPVTEDTRLYVTFLSGSAKGNLEIPYTSSDKAFRILKASPTEIISVLDVSAMGSVDAMSILEKEWGKGVTTRNWNTVEKLVALKS